MSSVETGQMSAVETGQMSAAETGQMSSVPESSGFAWACGSELFNARWHEERSCFLEARCCILLMIPCDFERICLQHAATECMQKSSKIC